MQASAMMQEGAMNGCPMMRGAGGTLRMITMGLIRLFTMVILLLGIAALVKYLRSEPPRA